MLQSCNKDIDNEDNVIQIFEDIYNYRITDALGNNELLESEVLQECFNYQIDQFFDAKYDPQRILDLTEFHSTDDLENFVLNLTLGDILLTYNKDSLAHSYYKKAEQIKIVSKSDVLKRELYLRLMKMMTGQEDTTAKRKMLTEYFNSYSNSISNKDEDYSFLYYKFLYQIFESSEQKVDLVDQQILKKLDTIQFVEPMQFGSYLQLKGMYHMLITEDSIEIQTNNLNALSFYQKSKLGKAKRSANYLKMNIARSFYVNKDYEGAIGIYNQILEDLPKTKNEYSSRQMIYEVMSKSYESLNEGEKSLEYLIKSDEMKDSLRQYKVVGSVYESDLRYNLIEKDNEIGLLTRMKNIFKWQVILLLPLAIFLTFLANRFYTQYLLVNTEKSIIQTEFETKQAETVSLKSSLTKFKNQVQELEQEREETIDRLQQLKEVVTKDFIILQDKSKVYVEELMFIQSDDHYLKVHLHNKKDNFVRGKISQIIEDLPPNFIRCHRSFIVNENYIERFQNNMLLLIDKREVPVSKKYRDTFRIDKT